MSLKLITGPAAEPLTLNEARLHLRLITDPADATAHPDDAYVSALIASAREAAEHLTGRALMQQTWELALNCFPDVIELPKPPLVSVTSVKYIDQNGDEQSFAGYQLDTHSEPTRLLPAFGESWPSTRLQPNAVVVRYVAGYAGANAVPQQVKSWMLLRIGMLYENRESVSSGAPVTDLPQVDRLLDGVRVWGLR
jgi:uncharacterized phiE125 gp8 family phage protein